eukprot:TRINITY_DN25779_c0_g1_i2.p1 TRINITY_DN25779_c0_g1~~TRINITY_DN25779_c0_g1_i2.p1  ORF type:complete len:451 (+),score=101.51 TRINITY_DN25779_c0_g1_i2:76-1353(+)
MGALLLAVLVAPAGAAVGHRGGGSPASHLEHLSDRLAELQTVLRRLQGAVESHTRQTPSPAPPASEELRQLLSKLRHSVSVRDGALQAAHEELVRSALNTTPAAYYSGRGLRVRLGCGAICQYDKGVVNRTASRWFDALRKEPVDCRGLWANQAVDEPAPVWPPPVEPPNALRSAFTLNGKARVESMYAFSRYAGGEAATARWTEAGVEEMRSAARAGRLQGSYGYDQTHDLQKALRSMPLRGSKVLVVGSEQPWVEAALLAEGAEHVTTIEYGAVVSTHPKVTALTPGQARALYAAGRLGPFDHAVSYSSIEHSGLGRYGDALNPWGDLQAAARVWCVTRPGGLFAVGLPVSEGPWGFVPHKGGRVPGPWPAFAPPESDMLAWNAHRVYGPARLPHLFANWEQVATFTARNFIFVVRRSGDTHP